MSTHTASNKELRMTGLVLAALLVFVLVSLPIIYLLRHSLSMMIASPMLAPYGIELRSIAGLKIGLHAMTVDSIRFVIVDPNKEVTAQESSIENARVTFTPDQLVMGRVQTIEVASLALFGTPYGATGADSAPTQRPGSALQLESIVASLQDLPVDSITVNSVSINPYFSNAGITMARNQREISVQVQTSDFNLSMQTNWHDTAFVSSYFIPDAELPGHVFPGDAMTGAIRLYFRDELAASADFSLGQNNNLLAVDGTGELLLSALVPFLQHHELLAGEQPGYEGTIRLSASGQEQQTAGSEQQLGFLLSMSNESHASVPIPYPGDTDARLLWPAGQPLQVSGIFQPQSNRLSLNANDQHLHMTLQSQGEERQFTLDLTELSAQCAPDTGCIATQSSAVTVPYVVSGTVVLENFSAVTNAELTTSESALTLRLGQGSRISADIITSGANTLEDVNLLVLATLTLGLTASGDLQAHSDGVELALPSIRFGENNASAVLQSTDLNLRWPRAADAHPEMSAEVQIRNPGSNILPVVFRDPQIDASVVLADNSLQVNSEIRLAERNVLQINATHSLSSGTGEGSFEMPPMQFDAGQQSLSQLFFSMPFEADLISGTLAATAQLRWHQDDTNQFLASGPISISADQLSGFYEDIALVGLSTALVGELADLQFASDENLQLQIGSIDPGLPIENIALEYTLDTANTSLEIRNVEATMFNGTLSSTGLAYDWSAPENLFAVAFNNVDLSRLLAMGAYEGINATGLVSGAVPVRIAGSNVSVQGGTLQVQPPGGSIRYQPATAGDTGNAALDLVNLALSNYQYDVMDAEVDYLPSGELNLAVKLEGISPAVNEGQQINVNLNVTDNIPALLESLQASRNITDALQRELDER